MKSTVQPELEFAELVKAHHAMVWRYLRLLGCEPALAEDLTQETFLALLRKPLAGVAAESIGAYLRSMARNRFLDAMRKQRKVVSIDLAESEQLWLVAFESEGEMSWSEALDECLQLLDGRPRQVLDLRYRDQLPIRTVADKLDMKESGVKTLLGRIKGRLRQCIERKVNRCD